MLAAQLVDLTPATQLVAPGEPVVIRAQYSTDPLDNTLTGIGLRLHFDSQKLQYNGVTGVFPTGRAANPSLNTDTTNYDLNADTDSYLLIPWFDLSGNWPNVPLPLELYTAHFTATATASGTTTLAVTASSKPPGYTFQATSATVAFDSNVAPVITAPGSQSVLEDSPLTFVANKGNGISIADPDAGTSDVAVTLTTTNGALSLSGTAGLDFSLGDGDNDASMTFVGALPDINTALQGLAFRPLLNYFGPASLEISVNDQGHSGGNPREDHATVAIDVEAVNDDPTISAVSDQTTLEDTPLTGIAVTVGDVETAATALTLSASVDNTALFPAGSITITGTGASRSVSLAPAANASGMAMVTLTTTDGSGGAATEVFQVDVTAVNDAPTISSIAALITDEDMPLTNVSFTVADQESEARQLTVVATADNTVLFPPGSLALSGTASNRSITLSPSANAFGTSTVTLTVTDEAGADHSTSFLVTVGSVNDIPLINDVANQFTLEDTPLTNVTVNISDVETAVESLSITATSDNQVLFPPGSLQVTGTGANRNLSLAPATNLSGSATITLTVSDADGGAASDSFTIVVQSENDLPTISQLSAQATDEDVSLQGIAVTVGDVETPANFLLLSATSNNPSLFPEGSITFGGTGAARSLSLTPATNLWGSATIQLSVMDGNGGTAASSFTVTVNPINDAPTINLIGPQVTDEDVPLVGIPVTLADVETSAELLVLTVTSNDPTLFPESGLTIAGEGAMRSISLVPAANQSGTATISVSVSDGEPGGTTVHTFLVTVNPQNDPVTELTLTGNTVPENSPGATIGQLTVTDLDELDTYHFTVNAPFQIVDGELKLQEGVSLNFETTPSLTASVTVEDSGGVSLTRAFAITVLNVNEAPVQLLLARQEVFADLPGAWVGALSTLDPDAGQTFTYSVADARFHVVDGNMYLKPGIALNRAHAAQVSVQISSKDQDEASITGTFVLHVFEPPSDWDNGHHWKQLPFDVNFDGLVTPIDALLIINNLNSSGPRELPPSLPGTLPPPYFDVSDDGSVSALDVVLVINYLNAGGAGEASDAFASVRHPSSEESLPLPLAAFPPSGDALESSGKLEAGAYDAVWHLAEEQGRIPSGTEQVERELPHEADRWMFTVWNPVQQVNTSETLSVADLLADACQPDGWKRRSVFRRFG